MSESDDQIKALHDRIAKAKAARAPLDEAAGRRAELALLEREALREENALRDGPYIAEAERTLGVDRIEVVDTDLGAIVVKRPHHQKFNAVMNKGANLTQDDLAGLVRTCVVYPEWEKTSEYLTELPATMVALADAVVRLAGSGAKARSGK